MFDYKKALKVTKRGLLRLIWASWGPKLTENVRKGSKGTKKGPKGSKTGPKGGAFLTLLRPFYSQSRSFSERTSKRCQKSLKVTKRGPKRVQIGLNVTNQGSLFDVPGAFL